MRDKRTELVIHNYTLNEIHKGLKAGTVKRKLKDLEKLGAFAEERGATLLTVTEKDLKEYLESVSGDISAKEYNGKLSTFRCFYRFLKEDGVILLNPAEELKSITVEYEDHLGLFTEDEMKRILEAIPGNRIGIRDRGILELLYSSALRINELVSLDVDDIDLTHYEVRVRHGKGDRERIVPVGERAVKALSAYIIIRSRFILEEYTEELFLNLKGRRINAESVRRRIRQYKRSAGVESRGTAHAFRHSCGTHMLKNGAPLSAIRRLLGHSNLTATERYTHVMTEDLKHIHKMSHPRAEALE